MTHSTSSDLLTITARRWGTDLVGRDAGAAALAEILDELGDGVQIAIDFSDVTTLSLSFADEIIGRLADVLRERSDEARLHVRGLAPELRQIARAAAEPVPQ